MQSVCSLSVNRHSRQALLDISQNSIMRQVQRSPHPVLSILCPSMIPGFSNSAQITSSSFQLHRQCLEYYLKPPQCVTILVHGLNTGLVYLCYCKCLQFDYLDKNAFSKYTHPRHLDTTDVTHSSIRLPVAFMDRVKCCQQVGSQRRGQPPTSSTFLQ